MNDQRPDPDALLTRLQAEEAQQSRGKLKIFFGATAGVGKTYAMLEAAHERRKEGMDVVVGWVDTHGRAETETLLAGLEILPRRSVPIAARRWTPLSSTRHWHVTLPCSWWTNWPIRTPPAHGTPNAGRMSRSYLMLVSMSIPRSMCSTWRA